MSQILLLPSRCDDCRISIHFGQHRLDINEVHAGSTIASAQARPISTREKGGIYVGIPYFVALALEFVLRIISGLVCDSLRLSFIYLTSN